MPDPETLPWYVYLLAGMVYIAMAGLVVWAAGGFQGSDDEWPDGFV